MYYLQLTCFRNVAFITFNTIYNTSNTAYIHTLLKTFTIFVYRYNDLTSILCFQVMFLW